MNVSNTIQRQIPLGSEVVFTLTTGREIEGVLTELGREHVTLERDGNPVTILTAMIGAWEIKQGQAETTQLPTIKPTTQIDTDSPPSPDTSASVVTESKRTSPVPITQPDPEILRMLVRIEERFDAKIQAASIDIKPVDFEIESAELGGKRKADAQKTWEKVKQKFAYAAKQRETHPKFGRIQSIVAELETLVEWYPLSPAVRRILGYAQWLADEADKAQEQFWCAARMSRKPDDWYNAAVAALGVQREARACRSLLQHYVSGGSLEDNDCWYVFVGLLARFHAHSALAERLRSTDRSFSDADIQLLHDTVIYLLMKDERNGEARSLVERSIKGDTALDLARSGSKHLSKRRTPRTRPRRKSLKTTGSNRILAGRLSLNLCPVSCTSTFPIAAMVSCVIRWGATTSFIAQLFLMENC